MKWVRWSRWIKNGGRYYLAEMGQMPVNTVQSYIGYFRKKAEEVMSETGAAHVVYAVKEFDRCGELEEVKFYAMPLSDEEFEKKTSALERVQVYALHKN